MMTLIKEHRKSPLEYKFLGLRRIISFSKRRLILLFLILLLPAPSFGKNDADTTDNILSRVQSLEINHRLNEATEILTAYMLLNPSDAVAGAKLADIFLLQKEFVKSLHLSRKLMKSNPDYDWPVLLNFKAALELKRFPEAEASLMKLKAMKTDANISQLTGDFYRVKEDFEKADRYYAEAVKNKPKDESLLKLRIWNLKNHARSLLDKKKFSEAIEVMKIQCGLGTSDDKLDCLALAGEAYQKHDMKTKAEQQYAKVYKLASTKDNAARLIDIRIAIALDFAKLHKWNEAMAWLDKAVSIKPTYQERLARANIVRDQGQYEEAEKLYQEAIKIRADDPYLYEARAWNFNLWDKPLKAKQQLELAAKVAPNDPRFLTILAHQQKNQRYLVEALNSLAKAKDICAKNNNCERFDEAYDDHFFDNTSAAGLSLDGIGVPVSISGSVKRYEQLSDIESLVRGLAIQSIAKDQFTYFLSPKLSSALNTSLSVRSLIPSFPIVSFSYQKSEKIGARKYEDPSVLIGDQLMILELEKTLELANAGFFTIFPYFKQSQLNGQKVHNVEKIGDSFKAQEQMYGLKVLYVISPKLPSIEIDGSKGGLKSDVDPKATNYRTHASIYQGFTRYLSLNLGINNYQNIIDSKIVQKRQATYGSVTFFPDFPVRVRLGYELVEDLDRVSAVGGLNGTMTKTRYRKPKVGLELQPWSSLKLEGFYQRVTTSPYSFYSYDVYEAELSFEARIRLSRRFAQYRHSFKYAVPLHFSVGYTSYNFKQTDSVPKESEFLQKKKYSSMFSSLKLFW